MKDEVNDEDRPLFARDDKFVDVDVPAVLPDERIDVTWADFRAGRDTVMEWILSRPTPQ